MRGAQVQAAGFLYIAFGRCPDWTLTSCLLLANSGHQVNCSALMGVCLRGDERPSTAGSRVTWIGRLRRKIFPTTAQFGYHRREFEGYLGNVGFTEPHALMGKSMVGPKRALLAISDNRFQERQPAERKAKQQILQYFRSLRSQQ